MVSAFFLLGHGLEHFLEQPFLASAFFGQQLFVEQAAEDLSHVPAQFSAQPIPASEMPTTNVAAHRHLINLLMESFLST